MKQISAGVASRVFVEGRTGTVILPGSGVLVLVSSSRSVKYRRAAVNYSYLDANWTLQRRRRGESTITTNTAITVVICMYLGH